MGLINKKMSPRERVLSASNHISPDRIPRYFGGTSSFMTDEVYLKALDYFDLGEPLKPYRFGHSGCYVDNRILEKLNVDVRMIQMQISLEYKSIGEGLILSDWGIPLKMIDGYGTRINPPFGHLDPEIDYEQAMDAIDNHPWPDGSDPRRIIGLRKNASDYLDAGFAVVGRSPQSASFLEYGCWLRGDALFYMDLMLNKEFAAALMDKILEVQMVFYSALLSEVGDLLDIIETAEDYGTQDSLLISPDLFREFIKPRRSKLNKMIKDCCPGIKILHHSCGAIEPIIGDLIETGIDILNPVQPGAGGLNPEKVVKKYGDKLAFCGGIDMMQAMNGSIQDVKDELLLRSEQFNFSKGGYLLCTSNHIQRDTPIVNLETLFSTV